MITISACIKFIRYELISGNKQSPGTYVLNPYDLFMLEKLVAFKKQFSCRIAGVTMAPKGCLESAQRYIAMGLDDLYFISDPCFAGADTYSTSYILQKALEYIGPADIYAFGEKSVDGETSQVPIGVSSRMNLPCCTGIEKISLCDNNINLEHVFADCHEIMEVSFPLAVCFKGFTTKEPEISLLQLKRSRSHTPIILDAASFQANKRYCGQAGSKTKVTHTTSNVSKRFAETIDGPASTKAQALKALLEGGGHDSKYLGRML